MKLAERDVTQQVKDFLRHRQWRILRHQVAMFAGAGERGMPDLSAIRYLNSTGAALVLWLELKAPSDRRKCRCKFGDKKPCTVCAQKKWHAEESARGALIVTVRDIESFMEWYDSRFAWLHASGTGEGQLDLLAGAKNA
jgi:hypothetical protein